MSEPIVIALGSNLGDRRAIIAAAVQAIAAIPGVELEAVSGVHETPALRPWGVDPEAPAYLNAVALARTTLAPEELLDRLGEIELEHGRVREERWGDRTLDLDIVTFGAVRSSSERLTLPHPRAHEREFVLRPWLELDPEAELGDRGRVDALLAGLEVRS